MMANEAFYYNLMNGNTIPVKSAADPALPKKFAQKKMPTRSKEEIEARFATVATNRMKLQENIVGKAKEHDAKVQNTRALKQKFDENMTLIGSTVPLEKRQTVGPVTKLPLRLQERLASLPKAKATNQILAREKTVASNLANLLDAKKVSVQKLRKKVGSKTNKVEEEQQKDARISALPLNLQQRLQALPKCRGTDAIIAKEELASLKAMTATKDRASFASNHNSAVKQVHFAWKKTVETTKIEITESTLASKVPEGIKLPFNLRQRLHTYPFGCDDNGAKIMAKEAQVSLNRAKILECIKGNAQDHNLKVKSVMMKQKFCVQEEQQVNAKELTQSLNHLPKRLQQRLKQFKKHSADEIIAKEELAQLKRKTKLRDVSRKANMHAQDCKQKAKAALLLKKETELEQAKSMNHLPKHLQQRLKTFKKHSADEILMKEENAVLRRKMRLAEKKMMAQKFTQARNPMSSIEIPSGEDFPIAKNQLPRTPMNAK